MQNPWKGATLISMPEIAELAKVKRPVVSTWRRRYREFPKPASGDREHPLFDAAEIANWLVKTGRAKRRDIDGDLRLHTLGRLSGQIPPRALMAALTSLIALRHCIDDELDDGEPDVLDRLQERAAQHDPADELLRSEVESIRASWLPKVVDELVEAAYGAIGAYEKVMDIRERLGAADLAADRLAPPLARLIAKLAAATARADRYGTAKIADPYAGTGDLLLEVSKLRDDQPMHLTACCSDPYLARLTRRRLSVHDLHEGDFSVQTTPGSSLQQADVIVAQLPYRAGEERKVKDTFELMSDLSADLRQGATAIIVAPADTTAALDPTSRAGQLRSHLIKDATKAIIRLPGGLVPARPGYEVALWVLNSYYGDELKGNLLVADISDQLLTEGVVDALAIDILTWREPGYDPAAHRLSYAVQLPIAAVVRSSRTLTPRYLNLSEDPVDPYEQVARSLDLERVLQEARPRRAMDLHIETSDARSRPRTETLGQLTKGARDKINLLSMQRGTRVDVALIRQQPGRADSYTLIGPQEACGRSPLGSRVIDRLEFERRYPNARRSLPGDVVITTVPEPGVIVDYDGYSVIEFPARVLRISELGREHFTPRVLAALLSRSSRTSGAIRPVQRLEELWLPLLSPADLHRFDRLLVELDERRRLALTELDALAELGQIAATGLADGTLTLADHSTQD